MEDTKLVFGPVPSRRLGRSMGINNIPTKFCSYSCIYCQVGQTDHMTVERQCFYKPNDIFEEVKRRVDKLISRGEKIDYLTFVSDGEPTLDLKLGEEMSLLKEIGVPIAVLTNASLLWLGDVKEDLQNAEYVSLKLDTVNEDLWKKKNRPHKDLKIKTILEGVTEFARQFKGTLVSETMLIDDVNSEDDFNRVADFLKDLKRLRKAYIAIPTRPPAEKWVKPAKEETLNIAFQVFSKKLGFDRVEHLIGYEGDAFAYTGKVEEDLLSITAVHPMRKEAVEELLKKAGVKRNIINRLLLEQKLKALDYEGHTFYIRKLPII